MAPKKTGHWNDPVFLHDLVVTFYEVGTDADVLSADMRKDIAARMSAKQHEVTWEGIRHELSRITMARQVMKWDQRVHEDILLAVFHHISFTSEQMGMIMDELRLREYTFSENALR